MKHDDPSTILFVTTGLGTGGAEMMLCRLIAGLDPARFRVSVVSLTAGGVHEERLRRLNVPVHTLGLRPGRPTPAALFRLVRVVRATRPGIIAGWMYHGNLAALFAKWLALSPATVVWNVRQSLDSLRHEKSASAAVIRLGARLSRFPEAVVYNSETAARHHEAIGYRGEKTRLIANGCDPVAFAPSAPARASVRAELGLLPEALLVGRFGRFAPMKDHAGFLAAAAIISGAVPQAHFILAGTGVDPRNEFLAARLRELGLESCVHLFGERHDLPRLTAALDLACSSSAFGEGFPNVVAEAMACGVPCVVTDVGDSAWLLGPGGRVVPPNDPAALAAASTALLQLRPAERRGLGELGRDRIAQNFSIQSAVDRFTRIFSRPVGFHPTHPIAEPCAE